MKKNSISVWLKDENNRVILQKRSDKNKSFQDICQATWSGKVEAEEDILAAVKRECKEELGEKLFNNFDFSKLELISEDNFKIKDQNWICYNYFGETSERALEQVKLHEKACPEFIFVDKSTEIFSIESGKNPKDNIVLFDDQYKVLKQILNGY